MHEALVKDVIVSKRFLPISSFFTGASNQRCCRNIYYQDPALFGTQGVVDRYVDILAYTFGLQRADLHVVSMGPAWVEDLVSSHV